MKAQPSNRLLVEAILLCSLLLLQFASGCWHHDAAAISREADEFADLARVDIYRRQDWRGDSDHAHDIVFVLGSDRDWQHNATAVAEKLAREGALVAGIHLDNFLRTMQTQHAECIDIVTLLDVFGQHLQQKYRVDNFQRPILVGSGDGAAFAYLTLAQAADGIFAGAVLDQLHATAASSLPFCASTSASPAQREQGNLQLTPAPRLADKLSLWAAASDTRTQALLHALDATQARNELLIDDTTALKKIHTDLHTGNGNDNAIASLPLVELRANVDLQAKSGTQDYFAIVISGDGGWANIDRDIGNALNARGIDVVGWNSLKYFWQRRTPQSSARDLQNVIAHYQHDWHKSRVLLIGFSLGADVIPFMLNHSTPSLANSLVSVVLLSPSAAVDFEFHVSNWLNVGSSHDLPTLPAINRLQAPRLQCFYGTDDDDDVCEKIQPSADVHIVKLPGDHHFDGDYENVTTRILANAGVSTLR